MTFWDILWLFRGCRCAAECPSCKQDRSKVLMLQVRFRRRYRFELMGRTPSPQWILRTRKAMSNLRILPFRMERNESLKSTSFKRSSVAGKAPMRAAGQFRFLAALGMTGCYVNYAKASPRRYDGICVRHANRPYNFHVSWCRRQPTFGIPHHVETGLVAFREAKLR